MKRKIIKIITLLLAINLVGCTIISNEKEPNKQNSIQETPIETYQLDYTKISPMIKENISQEAIDISLKIIDAFLQYKNQINYEITNNKQLIMTEVGYVLNCTCPLISAFTDLNEITSYDGITKTISWNYYLTREELEIKKNEFTKTINNYLSKLDKKDTESMKAILLYLELIEISVYNDKLIGEEYLKLDKKDYDLLSSPYYALTQKSGICYGYSYALVFLYTQADIESGTVLHHGGVGSHMWVITKIDNEYYYSDPTWDLSSSPKHFGMTAKYRYENAGGYEENEGTMMNTIIPQKYTINNQRFDEFRKKTPIEITKIDVDKKEQQITFVGYEYEYTFNCK